MHNIAPLSRALQRINFCIDQELAKLQASCRGWAFLCDGNNFQNYPNGLSVCNSNPPPPWKEKGVGTWGAESSKLKSAPPRIPVDERLSSSSFRHRRFSHFPFLVSRSARRRGGDCGSCLLTCFLSFLPRSPNACMHHRNPHAQICSSCIFSSSCHFFVCCWRQVTDFQEDDQ